jgi:homoserine kinase
MTSSAAAAAGVAAGGSAGVLHHTVQVPATSANLGPGFDSAGLALDLHLAARTVPASGGASRVITRGLGAEQLPTDDTNLVWRSFVTACDHLGVAVPDVGLEVTNRIPLERGLGSSSAAIVAGIVLARTAVAAPAGIEVTELDLVTLADGLEGHPDNVAPALLGGLVACARGDDGRLVVRRINPLPGHVALVIAPEERQSTDASRATLPTSLPRADVVDQAARSALVLVGMTGAWPLDAQLAGDRLHEPSRLAEQPGPASLLAALRAEGIHAWLSGSGPSVLALAEIGDSGVQGRVRDLASASGAVVLELALDRLGALSCPDGGCAISGVGGCAQCPRERLPWRTPA